MLVGYDNYSILQNYSFNKNQVDFYKFVIIELNGNKKSIIIKQDVNNNNRKQLILM